MKTKFLLVSALCIATFSSFAQGEEETVEEKKGFKKENLFTGGSVSLGFSNNTFLVGGNPVFGYSIAKWLDAGIVVNYTYTSYKDVYVFDDRLRQTIYGGGVFTRLFPVRFLFVQAQFEHNFIKLKYIPPTGANSEVQETSVNSFLVGAGYTTGRQTDPKNVYWYLAVLFDVADNENSPYTDAYGRIIPIVRGGVHVPLFQGGGRR